ncbi:DNA methyltransferase [Sphingomonas sp. LY54]|uniref:site-specific DNA-methyltransferase n=1 Tax=Sphingomonas sp. LY54 TaxID=3095343 RepID=UPI002D79CCAA|nr:DNA methyltransferase [Sphingomonas sp. LY54]WRP29778.1 DNA methyltransferase [Sphingomonas sp. LY54]
MRDIANDNPRCSEWSLHVVEQPPGALKPAKRNARTHSEKQIEQLKSSIAQFGFTNPVLVDARNRIVAGHGRVEAAKRLGLAAVPTVSLSHLSEEEVRAYALADNKLALNAGWDEELLRLELGELSALDLTFDLEITGFSTPEMDVIIDARGDTDVADNGAGREPVRWPVTKEGDLWQLGSHRLFCGDSREPLSFAALMGEEKARMVLSDPPFNVPVDGHVCGAGGVHHREFAMASGEMSRAEFTEFLRQVFSNEVAYSVEGALHFQFMDWRHQGEMIEAGEAVYTELKNLCVWVKDNGGMGSLYRSQHELVFVWKAGSEPHINNVELGRNGRYRTNVWTYRGATRTGADAELALHPTVKPVAMLMDAIKDVTKRGDIILDAFGGSGSTLLAAEKTRRKARVIEYEPGYCDVTVERWQKLTGKAAVLAETGETFEQVKTRRAAEMERLCDIALGASEAA